MKQGVREAELRAKREAHYEAAQREEADELKRQKDGKHKKPKKKKPPAAV